MQIRDVIDTGLKRPSRSRKPGTNEKVTRKVKSPFMEILEEVLPPEKPENFDLHGLWKELPDAERELLESANEESLKRYRDIVRKIALATLKKNVRLNKTHSFNSRKEKKEQNTIIIIDERLHKMALMMHSPDNSAFQLLKDIEEIRGLLFDVRE